MDFIFETEFCSFKWSKYEIYKFIENEDEEHQLIGISKIENCKKSKSAVKTLSMGWSFVILIFERFFLILLIVLIPIGNFFLFRRIAMVTVLLPVKVAFSEIFQVSRG